MEAKDGRFTLIKRTDKTPASSNQSKIDFLFAFLVYARLHETFALKSITYWLVVLLPSPFQNNMRCIQPRYCTNPFVWLSIINQTF